MKKEEKTERTKERIIDAAIQEFGAHGYAAATLNAICSDHGIAKGLLYHNFTGKEDLYLNCVSKCFAGVSAYLREQDAHGDLQKYMEQRFRYFSANPLCARIFFEAVLQPPQELKEQIRERKRDFDLLNRQIYRTAIDRMTLRENVTESDAMAYYEIMQEMFNGYFSSPAYAGKDLETVVTDHEDKLGKMLDLMLYGIADRRVQK